MIIARLAGGLANQMGIYAAACSLARQHGVPVKVDLEGLAQDKLRCYELDKLATDIAIATPEEVRAVAGFSQSRRINKLKKSIDKRLGTRLLRIYREGSLHFDPAFYQLPANTYLFGNFPSYQYYRPVFESLQQDFRIGSPLSDQSREWLAQITSCNAVSLHVRRTDYVDNPKAAQYHGSLGLPYYEKAVAFMQSQTGDEEYFVFSDDHQWVRQHLQIPGKVHLVDCNGVDQGYQDFELMRNCRHHIMANSGFSRWAALLCEHTDKIVLRPRQWTTDALLRDEDIGPESWILIDN